MSARLEFPLAQGWTKGLVVAFEDAASSHALALSDFAHVEQVHGRDILELRHNDRPQRAPLAKADGLSASGDEFKHSGARLLVKSSDCVPLIFVDLESERVAAVHAGWRGIASGIHLRLFEDGRLSPKRTWVWIGPSLSGESFEVGEDLRLQFPRHKSRADIFTPRPNGKFSFHVWSLLQEDFRSIGVELVYNVEVDTLSTPAFGSYRRSRTEGLPKAPQQNYSWVGFPTL